LPQGHSLGIFYKLQEEEKQNDMLVKGPALWQNAKNLIPRGNQLLSKRSEKFLPGLWPAYYAKAKGCAVIHGGFRRLT